MVGEKAGKVNLSEVLKVRGCGASLDKRESLKNFLNREVIR